MLLWKLVLQQQAFCNKLSLFNQKVGRKNIINSYIATTKQLQKRSPLNNKLQKNATCLYPNVWVKEFTIVMIENLAKWIPHIISEKEVRMSEIYSMTWLHWVSTLIPKYFCVVQELIKDHCYPPSQIKFKSVFDAELEGIFMNVFQLFFVFKQLSTLPDLFYCFIPCFLRLLSSCTITKLQLSIFSSPGTLSFFSVCDKVIVI